VVGRSYALAHYAREEQQHSKLVGSTSQIWLAHHAPDLRRVRQPSLSLGRDVRCTVRRRDRAGSLDWQTFKVPEYGTRVEYPAGIFAAVGEAEKGVGQRFEER
jgi:hypothetical protein